MTWPEPPEGHTDEADFLKLLYQAEVEQESARLHTEQQSALDLEAELNKAVHDARLQVAREAIDRGRNGAEFVRNAAAVIVTLYTGVLGLTFSAGKDSTPLPVRGLAPAFFLAVALVLATAYAALLAQTPPAPAPEPHSQPAVFQERRLNAFVEWVSRIAFGRVYFLHAAVISLGFGVLLLPTAFLAIRNWIVLVIAVSALVCSLILPRLTAR